VAGPVGCARLVLLPKPTWAACIHTSWCPLGALHRAASSAPNVPDCRTYLGCGAMNISHDERQLNVAPGPKAAVCCGLPRPDAGSRSRLREQAVDKAITCRSKEDGQRGVCGGRCVLLRMTAARNRGPPTAAGSKNGRQGDFQQNGFLNCATKGPAEPQCLPAVAPTAVCARRKRVVVGKRRMDQRGRLSWIVLF
jgi:hypothetical protein